jgi:hypothetical protein
VIESEHVCVGVIESEHVLCFNLCVHAYACVCSNGTPIILLSSGHNKRCLHCSTCTRIKRLQLQGNNY